jgi:hypothetical protein
MNIKPENNLMKQTHSVPWILLPLYAVLFFALSFFLLRHANPPGTLASAALTVAPWQGIGGCGAGGSGGAGGGIAKWVGKGVTGGLLNLQAMGSTTFGQDFQYTSFNARFSTKPTWKTEVGLAVPFLSKTGKVQFRSNQQEKEETTGGLGDLSLDASYSFGSIGQYSSTFSLGMPTGQYDIKRGPDGSNVFLPTSLQKGTGVWNPALQFSYTRDWDQAMLLCDLSYTHPVAMRLFSGENVFLSTYGFNTIASRSDERFYYRFKPYGENDLGDFFPPSTTLGVTWAYRGHESRVQSIGVNVNVPLGVSWIHSEKINGQNASYDPRPDPDFKRWSATFQYGYEFSSEVFPVYVALQLPLYAKKNPVNPDNEYDAKAIGKWSGPDWSNFLQTGSVYLAFKSTFF